MSDREAEGRIERLREDRAYRNEYVAVHQDEVRFADGRRGRYTRIIENEGHLGVAVLPLAGTRIGLVRAFRYPLSRHMWEIPRGYGGSGPSTEEAARELYEETNLRADELTSLGAVHPNSGLLATEVRLYAARVADGAADEASGGAEVTAFRWWEATDVFAAITSGELTDSFTLAGVLRATLAGLLPPPRRSRA